MSRRHGTPWCGWQTKLPLRRTSGSGECGLTSRGSCIHGLSPPSSPTLRTPTTKTSRRHSSRRAGGRNRHRTPGPKESIRRRTAVPPLRGNLLNGAGSVWSAHGGRRHNPCGCHRGQTGQELTRPYGPNLGLSREEKRKLDWEKLSKSSTRARRIQLADRLQILARVTRGESWMPQGLLVKYLPECRVVYDICRGADPELAARLLLHIDALCRRHRLNLNAKPWRTPPPQQTPDRLRNAKATPLAASPPAPPPEPGGRQDGGPASRPQVPSPSVPRPVPAPRRLVVQGPGPGDDQALLRAGDAVGLDDVERLLRRLPTRPAPKACADAGATPPDGRTGWFQHIHLTPVSRPRSAVVGA